MIQKAELHVHLEGTITPSLAKELARRNGLRYPHELVSRDEVQYESDDFLHFLQVYDEIANLIKVPQDYYDITYDYLKHRSLEGAIYVEMMYSPDHAERATGIASIEHLLAIDAAIADARRAFQIEGRVIVTAVRHFGVEAVIKVAKGLIECPLSCVVGFGLGGDELNYPPLQFKPAFDLVAAAGYPCTIHAGEFGSAAVLEEVLRQIPVKRIGHGVAARQRIEVVELLKEKGVALELCPTSNVYLKIFKSISEHPLPYFLAEGVRFSINSDDPPFMRTCLGQEYEQVQRVFYYSDETMLAITKMAIEDSFASPETKKQLLERLSQQI